MFIGHAAVALAIVGIGAHALGWSRERALVLAVFAGLVATLPDIDMLYALTGLANVGTLDALAVAEGFWSASTVVHRSVTHSLVLALPVAAGIGLVAAGGRLRLAGVAIAIVSLGLIGFGAEPVFVFVTAAFLVGSVGLGFLADRWSIGPKPAALSAVIGLVTHPFGDLFTGQPPWLLYPFETQVIAERVALAGDPTLHLLGAFFLELMAIWVGVNAILQLRGTEIREHLRPRAVLGGGYALAILVLPAPTLSVSYHWVFGVTAVGFIGAAPPQRRLSWTSRLVTGLAAVTVAGLAYAGAYLVLGV